LIDENTTKEKKKKSKIGHVKGFGINVSYKSIESLHNKVTW
jgi:hypothetical protein